MKDLYSICIVSMILLCSACNGDIFVEPVPYIEDSITLSCDSEPYVFHISRKGLMGVSFDNDLDYFASVVYYDHSGERITHAPAIDEVSRIMYLSPRFALEFEISDDEVTARALDNTYDQTLEVGALLKYEHETKEMTIFIAPGKPLKIENVGYDIVNPVSGLRTEQMIRQRFTNGSSITQHLYYYPYKDVQSKVIFKPEDFWAESVRGVVSIPIYVNGEWIETETSKIDVKFGVTNSFYSENTHVDEEVSVEVPPNSSVVVEIFIKYAFLEVGYLGTSVLPDSNLALPMSGKCILYQPIDYIIDVKCED